MPFLSLRCVDQIGHVEDVRIRKWDWRARELSIFDSSYGIGGR